MLDTNIFTVGGTVQAGQGRYLERKADEELLGLCREGTFAYILSARQKGKSSLMMHTAERLANEGIRTVKIDLTLIGTQLEAESWYFGLLFEIKKQLRLKFDLLTWWQANASLGITQRLSLFFEEVILSEITTPLVVFVDEIDTTLGLDFTDDFFAAIRALFTARARLPELKRLTFVLIGVATPSDLMRDPRRTPFNIGRRVEMTDFSFAEALPLTEGFNLPLETRKLVLEWILEWTGGHPYLTQRLCQAVKLANQAEWTKREVANLVHQTFFDTHSEQDNNIQFVRDMLTRRAPDQSAVLSTYKSIWQGRPVSDEEQSLIKSHLKLAGVVRRDNLRLKVSNLIYRTAFDSNWIKTHLPINWAGRFRQAARLIIALLAISVVMTLLTIYAFVQQAEADQQRTEARTQAAAAVSAQKTAIAAQATAEARRLEAEAQSRLALSRELAANAISQSAVDTDLAILLAIKGIETSPTVQAEAALRQILLSTPLEGVWRGHAAAVNSLAISPDSKFVVSASGDGTAVIWDLASGKPQLTLRGHSGTVNSAAFSPDGKIIATGGADKTVRLWDAASGKTLLTLTGHDSGVNTVNFSLDGKWLVSGSTDTTARVWEVSSGQTLKVLDGHLSVVSSAAFSPDSARLVTASYDGTAKIWDAKNGQELKVLQGHSDRLNAAVFSPDGTKIYTASRDFSVRIWSADSGLQVGIINQQNGDVRGVAISPDGTKFVTVSADKTARIWDSATNQLIQTLNGHSDTLNAAVFSSDGQEVLTASSDNTIRRWNISRKPDATILRGHKGRVNTASFSPDGTKLVTAGQDGQPRLWEVSSGKLLTTLEKNCVCEVNSITFSYDGRQIALANADGTVEIWETSDYTHSTIPVDNGRVNSVAFSPDGTKILTVSAYRNVYLWDLATQKKIQNYGSDAISVNSASFSRDGIKIITASGDNTARVWETTSGKPLAVLQGHSADVIEAAFSPDDAKIATASRDATVRLWDAKSGKELMVLRGRSGFNSVSFSANGRQVAAASDDGSVSIWLVENGKLQTTFTGHQAAVNSVRFSPDGKYLVTTGEDSTVRLYRQESFMPLDELVTFARSLPSRSLSCDEQKEFLHQPDCQP